MLFARDTCVFLPFCRVQCLDVLPTPHLQLRGSTDISREVGPFRPLAISAHPPTALPEHCTQWVRVRQ